MAQKTGEIICVVAANGRRHDFRIFKESGLRVLPETEIQADTGYQGLQKRHEKSKIPFKATKKHPLTKEQKQANHALSSTRVRVEHVIRTLKIFRILSERYRNRRRRFGLRLNLIAAICNMQRGELG